MARGGGGGGSRGGGSRGGGSRGGGARMGGSIGRGGRSSSSSSFSSFGSSRSYFGYSHGYRTRSYGMRSSGIVSLITTVIVAVIALVAFLGTNSSDITKSTYERTPLDKTYVTQAPYINDEIGWIRNTTTAEKGLKHFFDKTGVQPHLLLIESVDGDTNPTADELWAFGDAYYSANFQDEAHVLFIFREVDGSGDYDMCIVTGVQAKTVVDQEAEDILYDYVDSYYYSNRSEDELFSEAFADAADRMMTVTKSPLPIIIILVAIIAIMALGFVIWRAVKKQKNLEAEQTERILNTDLDTLG